MRPRKICMSSMTLSNMHINTSWFVDFLHNCPRNAIICLSLLKLCAKLTVGKCKSNVCLSGKTAIVTGLGYGVAYETALELASRGCRVICTDALDTAFLTEKIATDSENSNVIFKPLDLSSLQSVRDFSKLILENETRLDLLINTDCVGATNRNDYTSDGILRVMQINHCGPFLLSYLLAPLLAKSKSSRIIFTTSVLAFFHQMERHTHLNEPARYKSDLACYLVEYANSKLCNMIAAAVFDEKLRKLGVRSYSVTPGLITGLSFRSEQRKITKKIADSAVSLTALAYGKSSREGAEPILHCALQRNLESSGMFYIDCHEMTLPPMAQIKWFRYRVWEETERLVGLRQEELLT